MYKKEREVSMEDVMKNNKKIKKKIISFVVMFSVLFTLTACSNKKNNDDVAGKRIVVGSKSFTESNLLAEIYALALEEHGYQVERKFNIAGSVIHQAILNNEVDVYPEYTGTALLSVLKKPVLTAEKEVYDLVAKEYQEQFNLTWLEYAPMNDGQGLVIRTEIANQYGIQTISDLQKNADKIRFASQGDFDERDDGIPALEKVYGPFEFASSVVYEDSLKYDVLRHGDADLAVAYTTEGALREDTFTLLEDDAHVWPPYNAAPVIRTDVVEKNPEIATILNQVSAQITTELITELNAKVDLDQIEMEEVAAEFFESIKSKVTVE